MEDADLHQLLILTHRGDRRAAGRLHALIAARLLAYARSLLRNDAAAEDIVQQVFLQMLSRSRREIAAVSDALPWFIRLTRNAAFNQARSNARSRHREHARIVEPRADATDPHAIRGLRHAIGELDDDDRELILLKHVAGLTFDQMALSLDENRSTIASRYRSAITRLNTVLSHPAEAPHA